MLTSQTGDKSSSTVSILRYPIHSNEAGEKLTWFCFFCAPPRPHPVLPANRREAAAHGRKEGISDGETAPDWFIEKFAPR